MLALLLAGPGKELAPAMAEGEVKQPAGCLVSQVVMDEVEDLQQVPVLALVQPVHWILRRVQRVPGPGLASVLLG